MIPQANPGASYRAHQADIDAAIQRVLKSGRYILGEEVEAFEAEFAAYLGVRYCLGVGNGTDALRLAIMAAVPYRGAEAITVSMSATATASAIMDAGWQPIFVDIDEQTYTMSMTSLKKALTAPGMFIVPVHLYGHAAPMDDLLKLAEERQAIVIEDCAQAHGGMAGNAKVGSLGVAGAFSFYPTKNLGALGDGGAVVTGSAEIAERVRLARMYGWHERYVSDVHGTNTRLDEIQAAILRVKLTHLDDENARRRHIAAQYSDAFADLPLHLPPAGGVFHQYVVRHRRRDNLRAALAKQGVGTSVLYPVPIHLQPAYAESPPVQLPATEKVASELLCLPMYPELTDGEVNHVCQSVRQAVNALGD